MAANETRWVVCEDCGSQSLITAVHKCADGGMRAGQRLALELIADRIRQFHVHDEKKLLLASLHLGAGLLWLYRIAYRIESGISRLNRYKQQADLARTASNLGGELYQ